METQVSSMRRPCFRVEDDGLASIAGFSGHHNHNNHHNNNTIINHGYPLNHHLNHNYYNHNHQQVVSSYNNGVNGGGNMLMRRRNSLRNISSLSTPLSSSSIASTSSPRSARLFDASTRFDEVQSTPHFLESCFLCKKPLGCNRDIFMYRGDTPFCSEECRQEQIDKDEAKENNKKMKALRSKKDAAKSSTSSNASTSSPTSKSRNYPYRTGTVAAA